MATRNLLFAREYKINEHIGVVVPEVGAILDSEDNYYGLVSMLTAMPIDMMVQLDDVGIDFTEINEYELFLLLFPAIQESDTSLIFGSLDLRKFRMEINEQSKLPVLRDEDTGAVIDRSIHSHIASVLRKIHHIDQNRRRPGNSDAKEFMIERARQKMRRKQRQKQDSVLEEQIVALVCTEQYKYDFESTRSLTIYQFQECLHQIINKIDYDNRMHGVYAGTVRAKDLSQSDLNWLSHKK